MEFDLPLYAVQRLADGTWLVRSPLGDPLWPAVDVVAVIGAQASAAPRATRLVPVFVWRLALHPVKAAKPLLSLALPRGLEPLFSP